MPILTSAARLAAKRFPRSISPRAHATMDYVAVGLFITAAVRFWRRNKRAAVAALISGGAELAVNLLTDYPGGVKKVINFRTHRDIDFGLAVMTANMPDLMAFRERREKKFFAAQGVAITMLNQMTEVPAKRRHGQRKYAA